MNCARLLVPVVALALWGSCWAAPIRDETLGAVVEETGVLWSLSGHRASLAGELRQFQEQARDQRLTDDEALSVLESAQLAFDPRWMLGNAMAVLSQTLSEEDGGAVLSWARSPAGRRVAAAERSASGLVPALTGKAVAAAVQQITRHRGEVLRVVVLQSQFPGLMANMVIHGAAGVLHGFRAGSGVPGGRSVPQVVRELESRRQSIEAAAVQLGLAWLSQVYQGVSDQDLERYASFLETAAGSRFAERVSLAMRSAYFESAMQFGGSIKNLVGLEK